MWNSDKILIICQTLADQTVPREVPVGEVMSYTVYFGDLGATERFLSPLQFVPTPAGLGLGSPEPITFSAALRYKYTTKGVLKCQQPNAR